MALRREWMPSPNYSYRDAGAARMIVVHTAQGPTGAGSRRALGNYFASSSSQVSSHVGIDDERGVIAQYVDDADKAWTQGNANDVCFSAELCAMAEWSAAEWDRHPDLLANCADWVRETAGAWGVNLTELSASQAQGGSNGTCEHEDLGSWGGGHWDCGEHFPMGDVLAMARGGAPPATEDDMPLTDDEIARIWRWPMNAGGTQAWNELDAIWKALGKDSLTYDDITKLWQRAVDSSGLAAYAAIARINNYTAALHAAAFPDQAQLAASLAPVIEEGMTSGADAATIAAAVAATIAGETPEG